MARPERPAWKYPFLAALGAFYADPENVRRFEEWKAGRESGKTACAPPEGSRPAEGRHADHTASATPC